MAVSTELPEKLRKFVENEVERGRYNSKSELIRDALRLKEVERDLDLGIVTGRTVERLESALGSVDKGETYSPEEIRERHGS